ncbi:MAG: SipW-dependent-type signal peptide-containing protein [Clostridia bacterium]|nr:SipW-dependent-type signal peptide-containing protein [Clostridia bacterium]
MAIQSKKRVSGSTIAIIALSILLAASIGIGVALAYFTSTANVAGDITLGNPVTIGITQGGASATTLTFAGDALPGSVYDQVIGISTPANTTDALVRAKLTISNTDGATTNVSATTTDSWTDAEDGYYYYNGTVAASSNIDFVTAITVPTSLTNEDANKTFTVSVIVEAIQKANNAANTVWTTAPTDWLDTYSPAPATGE